MRSIMVTLVFIAIITAGIQSASAQEPLFDTEASTKHIEKGIDLLKEKKYEPAISELEEAVSINPDAEGYYYLGYAYYMKGRKNDDAESRKKSMESFNEAYELNPNFTPSRYKPVEPVETDKQAPVPPASETEPGSTQQSQKAPSQDQPLQRTPRSEPTGTSG